MTGLRDLCMLVSLKRIFPSFPFIFFLLLTPPKDWPDYLQNCIVKAAEQRSELQTSIYLCGQKGTSCLKSMKSVPSFFSFLNFLASALLKCPSCVELQHSSRGDMTERTQSFQRERLGKGTLGNWKEIPEREEAGECLWTVKSPLIPKLNMYGTHPRNHGRGVKNWITL